MYQKLKNENNDLNLNLESKELEIKKLKKVIENNINSNVSCNSQE